MEREGDPETFVADVGDALVVVPVGIVWQGFVDAVIEVFVVGEDDVAADVVELADRSEKGSSGVLEGWVAYESLWRDVCRGETAWHFVGVDYEP